MHEWSYMCRPCSWSQLYMCSWMDRILLWKWYTCVVCFVWNNRVLLLNFKLVMHFLIPSILLVSMGGKGGVDLNLWPIYIQMLTGNFSFSFDNVTELLLWIALWLTYSLIWLIFLKTWQHCLIAFMLMGCTNKLFCAILIHASIVHSRNQ